MTGLALFTLFHVLLSVVAIVAGLVVLYGLLKDRAMGRWTMWYFVTMGATLLTGFFFPFHGFTPAIIVGIISTVLLALAIVARYSFRMAGLWRGTYIISALTVLYLNCFVFVVQAFQKIPALHALAPEGSEAPFTAAQAFVFLTFVVAGYLAVKWFRQAGTMAAMRR
jgi:hypothetical protein